MSGIHTPITFVIFMDCPKCKAENSIVKSGNVLRKGGPVQRYQCKKCGSIFLEAALNG